MKNEDDPWQIDDYNVYFFFMKVNWINYKYDNGDFAILTVKKSSSWQKWDLNAYLKSGVW